MRNIAFALVVVACLASTATCQSVLTYTFTGDNLSDRLGISVSGAGDVNGDGHDDIIVGATGDDDNGSNCGSARVYSGLDGSVLYTFYGDSASTELGSVVSGAGDVNGDGFADLIVGAPIDSTGWPGAGSARVYSGATGAILYTFRGIGSYKSLGYSVSDLGDLNGDGYDDVLVGIPYDDNNGTDAGKVVVYSGFDGAVLHQVMGDSPYDSLGRAVSGAGDVNGDGRPDFMAGAYGDDNNGANSGSARVYSGLDASVLYTFNGDSAGDYFGFSVSGAGDMNGDGHDDLIVGAIGDSNNGAFSGSVRAFSGLDGSILYTFDGPAANYKFGYSISDMGDANGDGYADILASSYNGAQPIQYPGFVQVFSGFDGSVLASHPTPVPVTWGYSVAGNLDTNGDGFPGYVIGAYAVSTYTGEAYVFEMPTLPVLWYSSPFGTTRLRQDWIPSGGNPQSLTGTIVCTGGTPGGMGLYGLSFAPTDFPIYGFPLLIAIDSFNLFEQGNFGYDFTGSLTVPNVSRQFPFLAGTKIYIQFFETSPIPSGSNGLRMLLAP